MKRIGFIILAAIMTVHAYSQEEQSVDSKAARKMAREQRKLQEQIQSVAMSRLVDSLVNNRIFILEAYYLSNQSGQRVIVDEKVNFILIDSTDIIIQYGSLGSPMIGYNGLGGVTTDGNITKFKVTRTGRNKDRYSIQITALTTLGIYDVLLLISPDGNATATIGGNTRGKLVYHGNIIPVKDSRIYKGSVI